MSNTEHLVCHGAICSCLFGDATDTLEVTTQDKNFINDDAGSEKLIATNMELGQPFTAKTFGQCKLQPAGSSFKICQPMIQSWQGYTDKMQLSANAGYPLLEGSKAVCAISGSPCVAIDFHGQVAAPSATAFEETRQEKAIAQQINPIPTDTTQKKAIQFSTSDFGTEEDEESEYTLESTYVHDHFKNVANDIIKGFEGDSNSVVYQLYQKVANGGITNPTTVVTKTPVSNQLAYYDTSDEQIKVWEKNLVAIENDTDKKIKLIQALTEAYSTHIDTKVKDQLAIKEEVAVYEYDVFRFDGVHDTTIVLGQVTSPDYSGDLVLDIPKDDAPASSKWVKSGPGQSVKEIPTFENPKTQPKGWPPTLGLKFSYSLQGGFTTSVYAGISYQVARMGDAHLMPSVNAALTYYGNGAPGTSYLSPHLINASITPAITLGYKTGNALNLNLFNSFTGSGVNVPYEYAFTWGATGVLSSGSVSKSYDKNENRIKDKYNKHDRNNRHQLLGGAAAKVGNFMISSYNDIHEPFLFYGMDSDQYWSAGVQLQAKLKHQIHMSYAFDLYYGKSNNEMPYNLDKNIAGQNYDYQQLFALLLNRGQETFTTTDAMGNSNTQTKFGYGTFWPSNMMHDAIPFPEVPKPPTAPVPEKYKSEFEFREAKIRHKEAIKEYNEKMKNHTISIQLTPNPTFHHLFVVYKNRDNTIDLERLNTYMNADVLDKSKNLEKFFTLEKKFKQQEKNKKE
ncbi:DUF4280 domain-containing protein [Aquimarina aquimarini]|uniref:DUF4280 domain-containing protein n=1 Tax=Aquimarina aquimarini TaxID=1191734 RepID=UPI000D54BE2C|nr:DUF4280 domain-containing protein [Aquimarina aquimarini]